MPMADIEENRRSTLPRRRLANDRASAATLSDRVDDALRQLLVVEVGELTAKGKGGRKCWAAVLLQIADKQSQLAGAPQHAIAKLIADILDPNHTVPEQRRDEVACFCRHIVDQGRGVGLGRIHRLSRIAMPFAKEVLELFGDDCRGQLFGRGGDRHLTLQQLLARLDPHQPFEVQATAVKILPDIVSYELRNSAPTSPQRQKQLKNLKQAVGMVGSTKYFGSLAPKMREVCKTRMTLLEHRIDKAGRKP
jgi:hypothetical protein